MEASPDASPKTVLHEVTKDGRHRIVLVESGGTHSHSPWFSKMEVGHFEDYFCSVKKKGPFPVGVFKAVPVSYQHLA